MLGKCSTTRLYPQKQVFSSPAKQNIWCPGLFLKLLPFSFIKKEKIQKKHVEGVLNLMLLILSRLPESIRKLHTCLDLTILISETRRPMNSSSPQRDNYENGSR